MTDLGATQKIKRAQMEAVVIRADGRREHLGVVSDSSRWWRYGTGRLLAWWRIRRANRHV